LFKLNQVSAKKWEKAAWDLIARQLSWFLILVKIEFAVFQLIIYEHFV